MVFWKEKYVILKQRREVYLVQKGCGNQSKRDHNFTKICLILSFDLKKCHSFWYFLLNQSVKERALRINFNFFWVSLINLNIMHSEIGI